MNVKTYSPVVKSNSHGKLAKMLFSPSWQFGEQFDCNESLVDMDDVKL